MKKPFDIYLIIFALRNVHRSSAKQRANKPHERSGGQEQVQESGSGRAQPFPLQVLRSAAHLATYRRRDQGEEPRERAEEQEEPGAGAHAALRLELIAGQSARIQDGQGERRRLGQRVQRKRSASLIPLYISCRNPKHLAFLLGSTITTNPPNLTNPQVVSFLREHPEFLERFVLNNVRYDTLERWTNKKGKRDNARDNDGIICS